MNGSNANNYFICQLVTMIYVVESGQVELASVAPRRTCCRGSPGLKTGTMCTHLSSPGASSGNKRVRVGVPRALLAAAHEPRSPRHVGELLVRPRRLFALRDGVQRVLKFVSFIIIIISIGRPLLGIGLWVVDRSLLA